MFKASDAEMGENENKKDGKNFGSPWKSDLFEQINEQGKTSPNLNTSKLFESLQPFSENEEDRALGWPRQRRRYWLLSFRKFG